MPRLRCPNCREALLVTAEVAVCPACLVELRHDPKPDPLTTRWPERAERAVEELMRRNRSPRTW